MLPPTVCEVLNEVVGIGTRSPIRISACSPSETRSCGLAIALVSVVGLEEVHHHRRDRARSASSPSASRSQVVERHRLRAVPKRQRQRLRASGRCPEVLSVLRLISESSTSIITSPLDLSFASMMRSAIATLSGVSLIVTEFKRLVLGDLARVQERAHDRDDLLRVGVATGRTCG